MKRKASAVWNGTLKEGKGTLSTGSGALERQPYSFGARFEEGKAGTNPEELIAAAEAGCFTMALGGDLSKAGHPPEKLSTEATAELKQSDGQWSIATIHLVTRGRVPGVDQAEFQRLAEATKTNCIVSRALNVEFTIDAKLE
ncbi:MAG TPA: OsmC family protein [Longimicrobiales bacterium]|nr:OsmC family protein [Longimicrobiales bacterium]